MLYKSKCWKQKAGSVVQQRDCLFHRARFHRRVFALHRFLHRGALHVCRALIALHPLDRSSFTKNHHTTPHNITDHITSHHNITSHHITSYQETSHYTTSRITSHHVSHHITDHITSHHTQALKGRETKMPINGKHYVLGNDIEGNSFSRLCSARTHDVRF